MEDRQPKQNGRNQSVKFDLTGVSSWPDFASKNAAGQLFADVFVNTVPGDGATVQGTPLSKQTLLSSDTANLLELDTPDPTVNDALAKIAGGGAGSSLYYPCILEASKWASDINAVEASWIKGSSNSMAIWPELADGATTLQQTAWKAGIIWTDSQEDGAVKIKAIGTVPNIDLPIVLKGVLYSDKLIKDPLDDSAWQGAVLSKVNKILAWANDVNDGLNGGFVAGVSKKIIDYSGRAMAQNEDTNKVLTPYDGQCMVYLTVATSASSTGIYTQKKGLITTISNAANTPTMTPILVDAGDSIYIRAVNTRTYSQLEVVYTPQRTFVL